MPPQVRYRVFERDGVFDRSQLRELIRRGEVTPVTSITLDGTENWRDASQVPELKRYFELAALHPTSAARPAPTVTNWRSWSLIGLMLLGTLFIVTGLFDIVQGYRSRQWPAAPAYIYGTEITRSFTRNQSGRSYFSRDLGVVYDYRVDGRRYTSTLISYGIEWKTLIAPLAQANAIIAERPQLAHYDPALPGRGVLHPGITYGSMQETLAGFALIFGTLLAGQGRTWMLELYDRYSSVERGVDEVTSFLDP